jgi:von Willebrand factor type A domain-containing protein
MADNAAGKQNKSTGCCGCAVFILAAVVLSMCFEDRDDSGTSGGGYTSDTTVYAGPDTLPYQPEGPETTGAAVAVLIDNSGSMDEAAPGEQRQKYIVARQAVEQVLRATRERLRADPSFPIKVGIYRFANDVETVLPVQPYDSAAVAAALASLPPPGGGTAIGDAMEHARRDLYRSGVFRKYLLVITDGESNEGRAPEDVAREIARRSEGGVRMYYVAFDVDPEKFAFIRGVGGDVLPAAGGEQLRASLTEVYEGKILAEAVDYGEGSPRTAADSATRDTSSTESREP